MKSVGLYAIQFFWNDGHDTGFYSHKLMRKLCQCGKCDSGKQEV
ncbi:MAG: gamma-butyrobetaine hydroxylase-like domain-containing protein [Nitrospinaceae bacterium]|nr:gamma-butyrobetaine hydroxylase-like domain-containing protein [Nitrospinaceae bacterium]